MCKISEIPYKKKWYIGRLKEVGGRAKRLGRGPKSGPVYYLQLGLKMYEWKLRGGKKFLIRRRIWLGNRILYYLYNIYYI